MNKSSFFHVFSGKEYACEIVRVSQSKSVALFLPGISGKPFDSRFDFIADACIDSEVSFFRFNCWDNPSELSKKSVFELLLVLDDVLFFLSEEGFKKIFLIGKSFGGELSLLSKNHLISGYILIAPPISVSSESNLVEFSKKKLSEINACMDIKVDNDFLSNISVPVLVIHGSVDPSIPLENSQKLVSLIKRGELFVVEEADHSFKGKDSQAFAGIKIKDFLSKFSLT